MTIKLPDSFVATVPKYRHVTKIEVNRRDANTFYATFTYASDYQSDEPPWPWAAERDVQYWVDSGDWVIQATLPKKFEVRHSVTSNEYTVELREDGDYQMTSHTTTEWIRTEADVQRWVDNGIWIITKDLTFPDEFKVQHTGSASVVYTLTRQGEGTYEISWDDGTHKGLLSYDVALIQSFLDNGTWVLYEEPVVTPLPERFFTKAVYDGKTREKDPMYTLERLSVDEFKVSWDYEHSKGSVNYAETTVRALINDGDWEVVREPSPVVPFAVLTLQGQTYEAKDVDEALDILLGSYHRLLNARCNAGLEGAMDGYRTA